MQEKRDTEPFLWLVAVVLSSCHVETLTMERLSRMLSRMTARHQKTTGETVNQPPLIRVEPHGGCQVNGPKVAKFLDR